VRPPGRAKFIGHCLPEGEHVRPGAELGKGDLQRPLADGLALALNAAY
jgi:hypothetical protein